jgi:hypothetical protein
VAGRRPAASAPTAFVQTPKVVDAQVQRALDTLTAAVLELQARSAVHVLRGAGSPEGVVAARAGTLYLRSDPQPGAALYVKESGDGVTGWVAK